MSGETTPCFCEFIFLFLCLSFEQTDQIFHSTNKWFNKGFQCISSRFDVCMYHACDSFKHWVLVQSWKWPNHKWSHRTYFQDIHALVDAPRRLTGEIPMSKRQASSGIVLYFCLSIQMLMPLLMKSTAITPAQCSGWGCGWGWQSRFMQQSIKPFHHSDVLFTIEIQISRSFCIISCCVWNLSYYLFKSFFSWKNIR